MKKFIIIQLAAIVFIACNNNTKTDNNSSKSDSASVKKPATKDVYTCPMDTDVHSDRPGKCPKCGMDLVKKGN